MGSFGRSKVPLLIKRRLGSPRVGYAPWTRPGLQGGTDNLCVLPSAERVTQVVDPTNFKLFYSYEDETLEYDDLEDLLKDGILRVT